MSTDTKADKRLIKAAQAVAKAEREAAPALAEARRVADEARIEADAARAKVEAAFHAARVAVDTNAGRAKAADALARLANHPDLIDVLVEDRPPNDAEHKALVRRGLLAVSRGRFLLGVQYYRTDLWRDVAALAREIREKLAAEGGA